MATKGEPNWEELFLEQERIGQTVSAFCSARGINYHSFKNRKTHWNQKRKQSQSRSDSTGFIEMVPESKVMLRVELKNGRSLEVPSNFQEGSIRRLIGILESC